MRPVIFVLASLLICGAPADIEKKAVMGNKGTELYWWPKLTIPEGWVHDEDTSIGLSSNVLHTKGQSYKDAPTVIYARAFYKPDKKKQGTLDEFIATDIKGFRESEPGGSVKKADPLPVSNGKLQVYGFTNPGKAYEYVAYGKEGDFWIEFVLSSKSPKDLERDFPTYRDMLRKYNISDGKDG